MLFDLVDVATSSLLAIKGAAAAPAATGIETSAPADPSQLAFDHTSSYTSDGMTEFTGNNGFTVTDSYSCNADCGGYTVQGVYGSGSTAVHAPQQLAFDHTSSYTSDGQTEFTGNNGFTVTDSYSCKDTPCGSFTVTPFYGTTAAGAVADPSQLSQLATTTTSGGVTYDGCSGYTVVDSFSCKSGDCGGFSMGSFADGNAAPASCGAVDTHTHGLTQLASTYTDSQGNVYDGCGGYTVTDSFNCKSGECGGFTVGSFASGLTPPASCAIAAPVDLSAAHATKTTKPSPGSFMLAGHAMVLGAVEATMQMGRNAAEGKEVSASLWGKTFDAVAKDAASAVSPMSAFVLNNHVLPAAH